MKTYSVGRTPAVALLLGVTAAITCTAYGQPRPRQQDRPKPATTTSSKDVLAEATHEGELVGRVYSVETGRPISGAKVVVLRDGKFLEAGPSVGLTDKTGAYKVRTLLGRISQNLDVGRLLTTSLIGLIAGGATNTTKRIDMTRFVLQVSAPGHKPFEGVVTARALDAKAFKVALEPILLSQASSPYVSTAAAGWGYVRLESVTADPKIAKPREKVVITATVRAYPGLEKNQLQVVAFSGFWKGAKALRFEGVDTKGLATYRMEFIIGSRDPARVEPVRIAISDCIFDVANTGRETDLYLQVAPNTEALKLAQVRAKALDSILSGELANAKSDIAAISSSAGALIFDHRLLGRVCERMGDFQGATSAYLKALSGSSPQGINASAADLARSLAKSGNFVEIRRTMLPIYEKVALKDRPKAFPPDMHGAVGLALVDAGKLKEADELDKSLAKAGIPGLAMNQLVIEFRTSLRLATVRSAVVSNPNDARSHSDLGRVLLDLGRFEEALPHLQRAIELDPQNRAMRADYGYAIQAVMQSERPEASLDVDIDEAISAARSEALPKPNEKSKNFRVWHRYAILCFTKYVTVNDRPDDVVEETLNALREAIKVARSGANIDPGIYYHWFGWDIPLTGSEVHIAGFAYREAHADVLLLYGLKALQERKDDYYARLMIATGLVDLRQTKLADEWLQRLRAERPDSAELLFLTAQNFAASKRYEEALPLLNQVVEKNPLHSSANLLLAEVLSNLGDVSAAAARLAEHAKWYGIPLYLENGK